MRLFSSAWCGYLVACAAQSLTPSSSSSSMSNSSDSWVTVTSTRSCTSKPATVFLYTSNSSTFVVSDLGSGGFSPSPGGASPTAVTGAEYTSVTGSTRTSGGSSTGIFSLGGAQSTAPSVIAPTPFSSASILSSSWSSGAYASTSTNQVSGAAAYTITPSYTAPAGSYSLGSGPRSGTGASSISNAGATSSATTELDLSSSVYASTCPLPSTVTVSAFAAFVMPSESISERTVTSYISMASCIAQPTPSVVTYTILSNGSTVYITSTLSELITATPAVITYTSVESGSTLFVTSIVSGLISAQPELTTYTSIESDSTLYITSMLPAATFWRSRSPPTVTVYLTQTQTVQASQDSIASNGILEPASSTSASSIPIAEITSVAWQTQITLVDGASATCQTLATTTLISYVTSSGYSGSDLFGSIGTTQAASQSSSALPFGLVSTTASAASAQSCPETGGPLLTTLTLTSTAYPQTCAATITQPAVTSYIYTTGGDPLSCAANASIATVILMQAGSTSYLMPSATSCPSPLPPSTITSYLGGVDHTANQTSAAPNSVATIAASTIYACPPGASESYSAGLQLYTQTCNLYVYSAMDPLAPGFQSIPAAKYW